MHSKLSSLFKNLENLPAANSLVCMSEANTEWIFAFSRSSLIWFAEIGNLDWAWFESLPDCWTSRRLILHRICLQPNIGGLWIIFDGFGGCNLVLVLINRFSGFHLDSFGLWFGLYRKIKILVCFTIYIHLLLVIFCLSSFYRFLFAQTGFFCFCNKHQVLIFLINKLTASRIYRLIRWLRKYNTNCP